MHYNCHIFLLLNPTIKHGVCHEYMNEANEIMFQRIKGEKKDCVSLFSIWYSKSSISLPPTERKTLQNLQ